MKQRTLAREVSIKGSALHTGDAVTLTFKPAVAAAWEEDLSFSSVPSSLPAYRLLCSAM